MCNISQHMCFLTFTIDVHVGEDDCVEKGGQLDLEGIEDEEIENVCAYRIRICCVAINHVSSTDIA